jgi:large subunit ribosomal protein L24
VKTTKPRRQRKNLYQAPQHKRRKRFSAPLSAELKASKNTRSIPVITGDTVRIMRGDHRGIEGKVSSVDRKKYRIVVEGVTREKIDGTSIPVPIHPSKVKIIRLKLDDKRRKEILERRGTVEEAEVPKKEVKQKAPAKKKRKPRKKKSKVAQKEGGS